MQHYSTGQKVVVCAAPLPPCLMLVTRGTGGLPLHGPTCLRWSGPRGRVLFARVSSLSLHNVQHTRLLLGLLLFWYTIQPFPLCFLQAIVWQASSPALPSAPDRKGSSASFWSCIPKLTGMRVCPPSSPDRAQHGRTITSYFLLSQNSLSSQTQIISLGKGEGQCRKFSLSKPSFPTISLLDFGFFFF